jgi:hypothetical protein
LVDHLDGRVLLGARLVAFGLGGERIGRKIEHGQQADATISAGVSFDKQRPLAVSTPQFFGNGLFRR